ncbi:MAG: DNA-3-methyladenine glycosylase family protein [Acidimicrobiales bacterium]
MSTDLANSADAHRVVHYEVALDVVATLAPLQSGPGDPTSARYDETSWKALGTRAGPATVAARQTGPSEVSFWSWGAGSDVALANVDGWLGLDDTLEEFDPSPHPAVERIALRRRGVRMGRFGLVFERLVPTILGQLVIAAEAKRSYMRLVARHGSKAPGPLALRVAPAAATLSELGSQDFHEFGVERKRAETIRRAARVGDRLDACADSELESAYTLLQSIRGIGPWTAASVGRVCFGDPDAVIVGDYNLPHTVGWALAGKRRSTDEEMLELLEPFRPHRGRVQAMLKGGDKAPRRGPKNPFREIERH